jgi:hypothetical protein
MSWRFWTCAPLWRVRLVALMLLATGAGAVTAWGQPSVTSAADESCGPRPRIDVTMRAVGTDALSATIGHDRGPTNCSAIRCVSAT